MGPNDLSIKQSKNFYNRQIMKDYFFDSLISASFFKNKFIQTFGTICYWLEKLGIYFAMFLFIKPLADTTLTLVKAMQMHRVIGQSV